MNTKVTTPDGEEEPARAIQPDAPHLHRHEDTAAADLKASDPDLYAEIYGELPPPGVGKGPDHPLADDDDPDADPDAQPAPRAAAPAAPAAAAPAAGIEDPNEPKVPLGRLNEALRRIDTQAQLLAAKDEQLQLLQLSQGATQPGAPAAPPAAPEFDMKAKIKERDALRWEGKEEEALDVEMQIMAEVQRRATADARSQIRNEDAADRVQQAFTATAAQLIQEFPSLDAKSPAANKAAIAEVVKQRDAQLQLGAEPAVALRRAVKLVADEYQLPRVAPPAGGTAQPGASVLPPNGAIDARMVDAARRAGTVANTPPVGVGGQGEAEHARDTERPLTREEYMALPQAEKDRRLGLV